MGPGADKADVAKYKDNINSVMQAQFSDIVEEVRHFSSFFVDRCVRVSNGVWGGGGEGGD